MLKTNNQKGFLLIEVVIAIIVMSTALLTIVQAFWHSARANGISADYTTAITLAQKRMERLKGQDSFFWDNNCPNSNIECNDESWPVTINGIQYSIKTMAENYGVTGGENTVILAKVTVCVEWVGNDGNGNKVNKKVQLNALFNKNP